MQGKNIALNAFINYLVLPIFMGLSFPVFALHPNTEPYTTINTSHSPKILNISAIDWCPQICVDKDYSGYVIDIVNAVFKNSDYTLNINYFPWSRAIKNVTEGRADALLSPAKEEAPNLRYPKNSVGYQRMCFFVDKHSTWRYQNKSSLTNMSIGIATDTSIEELNSYIDEHPQRFQFQPYHERFIKQNALKILKKRIDTFIFTLNSTLHTLKLEGLHDQFVNAGCVTKAPIYLAFTPINQPNIDLAAAMSFFDKRMSELTNNGTISAILAKYEIEKNTQSEKELQDK